MASEDVAVVREQRQPIHSDSDDVLATSLARDFAEQAGFPAEACEEISIVATELASNVRRHAESGELTIARIEVEDRTGIRIESRDAGPGIDDVAAAFADGASTAGSLGGGLGAVNRLMDRVTVAAPGEPEYGTHVTAERWVRPAYEQTTSSPLGFGAASRPKTPGTANGDSFVIKRWNDTALVGVIDGLGHGPKAHDAAMAAKSYVEAHFDRPIADIFAGTERACRGTRGVVMALARFDWANDRVAFGTVGNITHKAEGLDLDVVQRRGVLGSQGPAPRVVRADLTPDARLVLSSDGVESHWQLADYEETFQQSPTVTARRLLAELGKDHDDATVLVVTPVDQEAVDTVPDNRDEP